MTNPNHMKGEMNYGDNSRSDHRAERFDSGAFFCPLFVVGNCDVVPEAGYAIGGCYVWGQSGTVVPAAVSLLPTACD